MKMDFFSSVLRPFSFRSIILIVSWVGVGGLFWLRDSGGLSIERYFYRHFVTFLMDRYVLDWFECSWNLHSVMGFCPHKLLFYSLMDASKNGFRHLVIPKYNFLDFNVLKKLVTNQILINFHKKLITIMTQIQKQLWVSFKNPIDWLDLQHSSSLSEDIPNKINFPKKIFRKNCESFLRIIICQLGVSRVI